MYLHAAAQHLTHQFVRLLVCVRKVLEFLPESMRDSKAAKTRSAAETRTTAIHEAGHTVLLIALASPLAASRSSLTFAEAQPGGFTSRSGIERPICVHSRAKRSICATPWSPTREQKPFGS
jgi:hypothetical protein